MRLLGITGRVLTPDGEFVTTANAGKDETATRLMNRHDYIPYALARPIKQMLAVLPGMEFYKWDDREWKEAVHPVFGVTRRHMAQTLGTEWRNLICEDLWLRLAHVEWEKVQQTTAAGMAISDIRFEHEVEWLRKHGGRLIVVIRNNGVKPPKPLHSSELGVQTQKDDYFIYNTGSLQDLYAKVDQLAEVLRGE